VKGTSLQSLIQLFFTDRLLKQLGVSPHTVAAYRDAFRLLLRFASERLRRAPSGLRIEDLDAPFLAKFLDHLEDVRGNCTRTRNNRLAALHALLARHWGRQMDGRRRYQDLADARQYLLDSFAQMFPVVMVCV
jgi:integrase